MTKTKSSAGGGLQSRRVEPWASADLAAPPAKRAAPERAASGPGKSGPVLPAEAGLLRAVFDGSPAALYVVDRSGVVVMWNPAAEAIFGWSAEEAVGQRLPIVGRAALAEYQRLLQLGLEGGFVARELVRQRKDGSSVLLSTSTVPLRDRDGGVVAVLGVSEDVTELRRSHTVLEHQATHDALTQLPNRRGLLEAAARLSDSEQELALVCVDIDEFATFNNTYGGEAGDEALVAVATRLRGSVRGPDLVGRLSGDQFGIFLPRPATGLRAAISRLLRSVSTPLRVGDEEVVLRASAGAAVGLRGVEVATLMQQADLALHQAKEVGAGTYRIFDQGMSNLFQARVELEFELRRAIEKEELIVYYQPITDLPARRVLGVEALVRWHHPRRGLMSPDLFIPMAEQTGLILPLGRLVLNAACDTVRRWQAALPGAEQLNLSVNVSCRQLSHPGLIGDVKAALLSSGLDPRRLTLEVTESMLLQNRAAATRTLSALRRLGVRVAMDDFGTGYSSLTSLRQLPLDEVKIDRSFVSGVDRSSQDRAIVEATLALSTGLGLVTVAEGVETHGQARFLADHGCKLAQGYLTSPPLPEGEFEQFLQAFRGNQAILPRSRRASA